MKNTLKDKYQFCNPAKVKPRPVLPPHTCTPAQAHIYTGLGPSLSSFSPGHPFPFSRLRSEGSRLVQSMSALARGWWGKKGTVTRVLTLQPHWPCMHVAPFLRDDRPLEKPWKDPQPPKCPAPRASLPRQPRHAQLLLPPQLLSGDPHRPYRRPGLEDSEDALLRSNVQLSLDGHRHPENICKTRTGRRYKACNKSPPGSVPRGFHLTTYLAKSRCSGEDLRPWL